MSDDNSTICGIAQEIAIEELMSAVDILYGYLPVEQVKQLHEDVPQVEALAQKVHHHLWHETTHEQRMMRRG